MKDILTPETLNQQLLPSPYASFHPPTRADQSPPQQPIFRGNVNRSSSLLATTGRSDQSAQGIEVTKSLSCHAPSICQCLQTLVILLEETEHKSINVGSLSIESMLAYQKEARTRCATILQCGCCTTHSSNLMLLAVVCEKLVSLCDKVVSQYGQHAQQSQLRLNPSQDSNAETTKKSMDERKRMFFGNYEISSTEEWEYMMRVLILLQLKSLGSLLSNIKRLASSKTRATQHSLLVTSERRCADVAAKLQQLVFPTKTEITDSS